MTAEGMDIGMVGLGVMGRNLLLNLADHGYTGAGYDTDAAKVQALTAENPERLRGAASLPALVSMLQRPRAVILLVPAGPPVDQALHDLLSVLEPGDIVIDGGNSFFRDTDLRGKTLAERGIHFLGVGISGGGEGARHGPSLMPGGPPEAYERVRPMLEAIAARADGLPCVAYLGPGSAGHYVKMVHNGIEYALMQLIAETYDLLRWGLALTDEELHNLYDTWNQTELNSYLLEITAHIFAWVDPVTGKPLIDVILDEAEQQGTGRWAAQDAMDLGVPAPTISVAVAMRDMSALKAQRVAASQVLQGPERNFRGNLNRMLNQLRNALYASWIIVLAQGMAQLQASSLVYGYGFKLEDVALVWQAGCIIRSAVLKNIRNAFHTRPDLPNLLIDGQLSWEVMARQADLRAAVEAAAVLGVNLSAMATSLGYFDAYRSAWSPANLIEAQRDYFGAHAYERVDTKGVYHTQWEQG